MFVLSPQSYPSPDALFTKLPLALEPIVEVKLLGPVKQP